MAKILVIDDESNWLELCRYRLREFGHSVAIVSDPLKAMTMVWYHQPDVIVLDVRMPKGGGLLLKTLKRHWPEIDVIMHSVYGRLKGDPSLSAADGFAVKSIDCADLVDTIARILKRHNKDCGKPGKAVSNITGRSLRRLLRQLAVGP